MRPRATALVAIAMSVLALASPPTWSARADATPAASLDEFVVAGRGVDVVRVRIVALDAEVRVGFDHVISMSGPSAYGPVGAVGSVAYRLRPDGAPAIDSGITIYESGRGTVGADVAGVEAGPVRYLAAHEGATWFSVARTIRANESGLLWHVFSTYPDASWSHRVVIEGRAEVSFLDVADDALFVVGREDYAPRAVAWGNGAWVFGQDANAVVTLDHPAYGFVYLGESLVRFDDEALGRGSLRAPSGATLHRDDARGLPGLMEPGTWSFLVDAGHYAILPAHFVGVKTPDAVWGPAADPA